MYFKWQKELIQHKPGLEPWTCALWCVCLCCIVVPQPLSYGGIALWYVVCVICTYKLNAGKWFYLESPTHLSQLKLKRTWKHWFQSPFRLIKDDKCDQINMASLMGRDMMQNGKLQGIGREVWAEVWSKFSTTATKCTISSSAFTEHVLEKRIRKNSWLEMMYLIQ